MIGSDRLSPDEELQVAIGTASVDIGRTTIVASPLDAPRTKPLLTQRANVLHRERIAAAERQ